MRRRIGSIILGLTLLLSLLPTWTFAKDDYHDEDGNIVKIALQGIAFPDFYNAGQEMGAAFFKEIAPLSEDNAISVDPDGIVWLKGTREDEKASFEYEKFYPEKADTFESGTAYGIRLLLTANDDEVFASDP